MLRTIAVLLLLLGLVTITPVACLCMPTDPGGRPHLAGSDLAAADLADLEPGTLSLVPNRAGFAEPPRLAGAGQPDGPRLVASSAPADVALLVATAAGPPSAAPWLLVLSVIAARRPRQLLARSGPAWAPIPPPPRARSLTASAA